MVTPVKNGPVSPVQRSPLVSCCRITARTDPLRPVQWEPGAERGTVVAQDSVNETQRQQDGEPRSSREQDGAALLAAEAEKVDEAVRFINERTILSGLELARVVGEYVLDSFFNGDYGTFTDPSRSKSTSFRALLDRDDILLGGTTVYRFVRISQQLKLLPADIATRLTLTHHRALLALPDGESKGTLARRALEEGWSSQVLEAEVRKLLPKSRAGRKPAPALAKGIRRVREGLDLISEDAVTGDDLRRFGLEKSSVLAAQLDESLERLAKLKKAVDDALSDAASAS